MEGRPAACARASSARPSLPRRQEGPVARPWRHRQRTRPRGRRVGRWAGRSAATGTPYHLRPTSRRCGPPSRHPGPCGWSRSTPRQTRARRRPIFRGSPARPRRGRRCPPAPSLPPPSLTPRHVSHQVYPACRHLVLATRQGDNDFGYKWGKDGVEGGEDWRKIVSFEWHLFSYTLFPYPHPPP